MANRKYIVNGKIYEESDERKVIVAGKVLEETTVVAAGGANPKGIFGMPLNRPMRGPM